MGIQNHIEDLRQRPDHEKRRYALAYSTALTALVFVVWLSVLFPQGGPKIADDGQRAGEYAEEFSNAFTGARAEYEQAKQAVSDSVGSFGGQQAAAGAALGAEAPTSTEARPAYDFGY